MGWYGRRGGDRFGYGYGGFAPYVPVARRRANAAAHAKKLAKKEGRELSPVSIAGRAIATSYWGKAWCDNLEAYSDFANRLPRGRTYARNGSVIDLQIKKGKIEAIVSGSEIYTVVVSIEVLARTAWSRMKEECSKSIASLIDLLQGKFDEGVMRRLAHPTGGLFPQPKEIKLKCSCPDYAGLCKHVAAVLYGVGSRLDSAPELLFTLRNVDHLELVSQAVAADNLDRALVAGQDGALDGADLGEMFGIELDEAPSASRKTSRSRRSNATSAQEAASAPAAKPRRRSVAKPAAPAAASKTRGTKVKAIVEAARKGKAARETAAAKTPRKAR